MARRVIIMRPEGFGYGGTWRYYGEIIDQRGLINDGKLVDLHYMELYDNSGHDRVGEIDEMGRRFISNEHRLSFLRQNAERLEAEEAKRRRTGLTRDDERQMETLALESAGLQMHENRGAKTYVRGQQAEPTLEACPVEGCEEQVELLEMKRHIDSHRAAPEVSTTNKSGQPRRKPGPKPRVAATSAA